MKDLRFYGTVGEAQVDVTFRTDLLSNDGSNFTVSQIKTGTEFDVNDVKSDEVLSLFPFQRREYDLGQFKEFAEDNNLNLSIANPDGSGLELLIEADESIS